jgi:hypothetical protein
VPVADPLRLLWQHVGSPATPDLPWTPGPARCARCTCSADAVGRLTDVISDKFTGWDDYATGTRVQHWCAPCAWGHVEPTLRYFPWVVTGDTGHQATPDILHTILAAPLTPDTAVVVPLSRKKHLIPAARWGVVTTDDVHLPWTATDAHLLGVLDHLRALGFGESALLAPVPRFEHLRTLPPAQQVEVMGLWTQLDPWRDYAPRMQVALRATRKEQA